MTADLRPVAPAHRRRRRSGWDRAVAAASIGVVAAFALTGVLSSSSGSAQGASRPVGSEADGPVMPGPLTRSPQQNSASAQRAAVSGPAWTRNLPASTTQAVRTVRTNHWCGQIWCTRTEAWEQVDGAWRIATRSTGQKAVFRSQIGARGFAAPGKRRQGDMRTPTGDFGIATTFSATKARPTAMPWRPRLPTSAVSDAYGKTYNTWLEIKGSTGGDRRMMSWGLWIDYNNPRLAIGQGEKPITGRGSGIFMHTSNPGRPFVPTAGCVQLGNPADMAWIVRWLTPDANPRIVNNR